MSRSSFSLLVVGLLIAVLATIQAEAAVLCQKRQGAVVVRDPVCKKKETQLDLSRFGAVGPTGAPGPEGPPGSQGQAGPPGVAGPTAASFGVRNPASFHPTSTAATVVSLTDPEATGGGTLTLTETSHLQITAALVMHHSGGTSDLPLGISCQPILESGSVASAAGTPSLMEVFGQSNHNAYVTMPIVADVVVDPGTYNIRIDCMNGFPPDSFPNIRVIDSATLNVIAIRQ